MTTTNQGSFDVLIVGAGPSGMVMAMRLVSQGITNIKILSKNPGIITETRAAGIHARTLELYRQIGVLDKLLAQSYLAPRMCFWAGGRKLASISLFDGGKDVTPFNGMYCIPQNVHEQILLDRCRELGITIDFGVNFDGFEDDGDRITAHYTTAAGSATCTASYIVGADGAHSPVRHALGLSFDGAAYKDAFFLADVEAHGISFDGDSHVTLDGHNFLSIFPYAKDTHGRIVGVIDLSKNENPSFEDVRARILKDLHVTVDKVHYFSTYRIHHRMARSFRAGRAFLIGDAAHIHSPARGQGLNTGVHDAVNLAWKLAAALQSTRTNAYADNELLLESYNTERMGWAHELLQSTDSFYSAALSETWLGKIRKQTILPLWMNACSYIPSMQRNYFMSISQTAISYRESALSSTSPSTSLVHAGDRLPWAHSSSPAHTFDNTSAQANTNWTVNVYGSASDELRTFCAAHVKNISLFEFPWCEEARAAGFAKDEVYLVRPDLYVARVIANKHLDVEMIEDYFRERLIAPL